ncbi:secondary thiamine-phosphate synthase enzyme YjbQ [Desulfatiferula olefinivorans]
MQITVTTTARNQMIDITEAVEQKLREAGINDGLCLVFVPHTTAGVTINENADPDVRTDILAALARMVPKDPAYLHREGNSDAHVKSSLTGVSATLAVERGRLVLGTWQSVFFCEFDGPRTRTVQVRIL